MNWKLIANSSNTGQFNMDFDIELASSCKADEAFFRLYRWTPFAISLGANQKFEEIDIDNAASQNIDVVKRPTGGRAILHAEELTYSVVVPTSAGFSSRELYQRISLSLTEGLKNYDPELNEVELESEQPDFKKLLQHSSGSLCFASTAKNEVKFKGKKIIGSAQRKMNDAILQHGSILCGKFHRKLPEFINADSETKLLLQNELVSKTTEIETILNRKVDYNLLSDCIIEAFSKEFSAEFKILSELNSKF